MDNRRLLWILNALVCIVIILQIFNLAGAANSNTTITSGNVATNLSVNGNNAATNRAVSGYEKAKRRGYYTASEYASLVGISLETVYRHANSGKIKGARLVSGRWRIPLMVD
jgi:excisionase family DNA binding protein